MRQLETASLVLLRDEYLRLALRFGTIDRFVNAWGYHNATHGLDVAEAAVVGARHQVVRGALPPEAVPLARIAGIFHDDLQTEGLEIDLSPRREELSVTAALQAMDSYESALGRQVFTRDDRAMVREMIMATKVTAFHQGQVVQNTSVGNLAGAVMADADLSSLGYEGIRRGLMLHVEIEGRAGRLEVPYVSDGTDVEPDRARAAEYLDKQADLNRNQRFLLPISDKMWPHKDANAVLAERLRDDYASGTVDWAHTCSRSGPLVPAAGVGDHVLRVDTARYYAGIAPPGAAPVAGPIAAPQLTVGSHRRSTDIEPQR